MIKNEYGNYLADIEVLNGRIMSVTLRTIRDLVITNIYAPTAIALIAKRLVSIAP